MEFINSLKRKFSDEINEIKIDFLTDIKKYVNQTSPI